MWTRHLLALCALGALAMPGLSEARVNSNTQVKLPNNLALADVTGDKVADFLVYKDKQLFITDAQYDLLGKIYFRANASIKRLFTGYFSNTAKQTTCLIQSDTALKCYGVSTDGKELWWAWTQPTFISDSDEALVGDFDANGLDDVLVYRPSAGTFKLYTKGAEGWFVEMPNFALGNLSNPSEFLNKQIRVGEFHSGAAKRQDDLLIYDPSTRQIKQYSAVIDSAGKCTFWWAYSTNGGMVASNEEVTLANVDGDNTEDLVLHSTSGGYRLFKMQYNNGSLKPITNVSTGQLSTKANCKLYWGGLHAPSSETGSATRDDALVYDPSWDGFNKASARWSGSSYTYWWAYTQYALNVDKDQDGDAIKTLHELGGYDPNQNGLSDVPLQGYGCSPFVPDVLVEVDYMAKGTGETASHIMKTEAVNLAVDAMAAKGINLHIFVDDQIPHVTNLGDPEFSWTEDFDPLKDDWFTDARAPFFHYCIFGHGYDGDSSSGLSRGFVASDFLVTLGTWDSNPGTVDEQAGTFLHELGHNLGLHHGGSDDTNFKPNFLSVMNYTFQTTGVYRDGGFEFFYSELETNDLDENHLNENVGVTADTDGLEYYSYAWDGAGWFKLNTAVDWNQTGAFGGDIKFNLNGGDPITYTILSGSPDEYAALDFSGGAVGSAGAGQDGESLEPHRPLSERLAHLMDNDTRIEELDFDTFQKHIAPWSRRLPARDLRGLRQPVTELQPLRQVD